MARRLEHRIAGADANPYLVLAAVLAGIHHGITNKIEPLAATDQVNVSGEVDPTLPFNWREALEVFQNSKFAKQYFTREYVDLFCAIKRDEVQQFNDHISELEYRMYL